MTNIIDQFDSNDFDVIDEQGSVVDNAAKESENIEIHNMASAKASHSKTDVEMRETIKKMEGDLAICHKRETEWLDQQDKFLEEIKKLQNKLEAKNEDLAKSNKDNENKIQKKEEENEALLFKCEEIKSLLEDEKQRCTELSRLSDKIVKMKEKDLLFKCEEIKSLLEDEKQRCTELSDKIVKMKETQDVNIQEASLNLEKETKRYEGLVVINDQLEEDNNAWRTRTRETELRDNQLEKKIEDKESQEKESKESARKMQNVNDKLKAELKKLKEEGARVAEKNEEFEDEVIGLKLELKKLDDEKKELKKKYEHNEIAHATDIKTLSKKIENVIKECDEYKQKSSEWDLEKEQLKRDFNGEKKQLNQAIEALNNENEVLRQRKETFEGERSEETRRNDFSEVMERINDDPGSSNERQTATQRTPNPTTTEQWYTTDEGEKLLREIILKLMEPFPTTELSRVLDSKDIVIKIKPHRDIPLQARFPCDFPNSAVHVTYGDKSRMLKFQYDRSTSFSDFASHVAANIVQM